MALTHAGNVIWSLQEARHLASPLPCFSLCRSGTILKNSPSICPSVRPSVHPPACPSVHPFVYSSTHPHTCFSNRPSIHTPIHPSVHPSVHPSTIYPLTHPLITLLSAGSPDSRPHRACFWVWVTGEGSSGRAQPWRGGCWLLRELKARASCRGVFTSQFPLAGRGCGSPNGDCAL